MAFGPIGSAAICSVYNANSKPPSTTTILYGGSILVIGGDDTLPPSLVVSSPNIQPGTQSTYANILLAIVAQLVAKTGLDPTAVGLSLTREPTLHVVANQYITITPGKEVPIEGQVSGAGRYCSGMNTTFYVNAYYRNSLDMAYQDVYLVQGLRTLVYQITDALQLFLPRDANGAILTEEPIRVLSNATSIKPRKNQNWVWISIPYQIRYSKLCNTSILL